jgi:hypothetical protein
MINKAVALEAAMKGPRAVLLVFVLSFIQACSNPMQTRRLLSVAVTPTSGTAQGSPGQIQFVATGTYNTEPFTVTPLEATWGVASYPQAIASATQTGLATCKQGGSGTTQIEAWVQISPAGCDIVDSAGRPGCGNVGGSAKLTCP